MIHRIETQCKVQRYNDDIESMKNLSLRETTNIAVISAVIIIIEYMERIKDIYLESPIEYCIKPYSA